MEIGIWLIIIIIIGLLLLRIFFKLAKWVIIIAILAIIGIYLWNTFAAGT
ncbi:MAG TPA: hypothetical protein VFO52_02920 [Longimicrobiales bacterium]|nr:hypothetical protein [Longimicrobiales bacterium]